MTRRLLGLPLLAALAFCLAPVVAHAQSGPLIDWGPDAFAWETTYSDTGHTSTAGSQLSIVGKINGFFGAFAGLDHNGNPDGSAEYTFYIHGLTSLGTAITPGPTRNVHRTVYTGGVFEIYHDTTPNAVFTPNPPNANVPSTFTDGALFLSGVFDSLQVTFQRNRSGSRSTIPGQFDTGAPSPGDHFTGGSAFAQVANCLLRITGAWAPKGGTTTIPAGYTAHPDGKIDGDCPTSAVPSTWGRVKGMYK